MTWIRTVPLSQAEEGLRRAFEQQKALYPKEYTQPANDGADELSGVVGSHSLIPDAL